MLIVDAHLDLSWNALQWNRDLRHSVYTIRANESHLTGAGRGGNTVALPEMRKGRVALCFATLLARSTGQPKPDIDYSSPMQAHGVARGQLAYYRALADAGEVRILEHLDQLNSHIEEWLKWEASPQPAQPPLGFIVSMESADPIQTPEQLPAWKEAGVRVIGPAHYGPGRYAGGTSTELGLTPEGISLIREMDKAGVILDLTHLTDRGFWEALEHYQGPILASHNNCRTLVRHQRQFDDEQIHAIIERGGVIGAALDNWMLRPSWIRGSNENLPATLNDAVDHIDHICQLAGNSKHVGVGSDLDGGFGLEQSPSDLDTIADLQCIADILSKRGYAEADIASIMHNNWLELLRRAWG